MSIFSKPTGSAAIEKRISDTRARRDKLAGDLATAQKAVTAARDRQRSDIVDADDATISAILQAVTTAEAKAAALAGALSDLDSVIQDLEFEAKSAREIERREAEAAKVDQARIAIEKLVPDLVSAAGKVADIIGKMRAVMPDNAALFTPGYRSREWQDRTGSKYADRDEALAALLAEVGFNALPGLDFMTGEDSFAGPVLTFPLINIDDPQKGINQGGQRAPASIGEAIAALILEPLAAQADDIREGAKALVVAKASPIPADTSSLPVSVFARKTFSWISGYNLIGPDDDVREIAHYTTVARGQVRNVPAAVAKLAISRSLAIPGGTDEARKLAEIEMQKGRNERRNAYADPVNLGDVLKLLSQPMSTMPEGRDVHVESAKAAAFEKLHQSSNRSAARTVAA